MALNAPLLQKADGKDGGDDLGSHPLLHDLEVSAGVGSHDRPTLSKYSLMASYGMAAWAWRSWEFAVALLLIELYPNSLLMVSAYGIADNLVRVALGSFIGAWVGRQQLVPAATAMYLTQNTCIGVSAGSALMLLIPRDVPLPPQVHWALLGVMIGVGALSSVGSAGVRITVEAEAVTALAAKDSQKLSQLNSSFRAIDLLCLLAAPMVVGAVMTFLGSMAGILLLAGYTLLAWMPEIALLRLAVHSAEALRTFKREPAVSDEEEADNTSQALDEEEQQEEESVGYQVEADTSGRLNSLAVYFSNPVLLPNLALAVLYCTVLSLGFLMTGYLQWTGLTSAEVSVYRGVGALTGLAATVLFPTLRRWLGLVSVGMFGIAYQVLCLTLGVAPVMLAVLAQPGGPGADLQPSVGLVRMLVAGVVASRTGLWTFDLAVTQLIQERCPPKDLSTVCGVQSSLQACFEMISFLAGVYLHDPHVFYWLMLASLGVVTLAALLYTKFAITQACKA